MRGNIHYKFVDNEEYTVSGLICTIYLPLPKVVKNILKYSVKNGVIYVEIGKSF